MDEPASEPSAPGPADEPESRPGGVPLYVWVLIAVALAIPAGMLLGARAAGLDLLSKLILNAIKAIGTPLVVLAILSAIVTSELRGRQAARMMLYYLINTLAAMLIGLALCNTIKPGQGASLADPAHPAQAPAKKTLSELVLELVPSSIGDAFAKNNLAQLVIVTLALGIGLAQLKRERSQRGVHDYQTAVDLVTLGFDLLMKVLLWVVAVVPLAVFGVVASSVGLEGFGVFRSLGWFIVVVLLGLACQVGWYCAQLVVFRRIAPWTFLRAAADVIAAAFSTSSTAATIPLTLEALTKKLEVSRESSRLAACVGTNFNNDGTALYQAGAVLFLAQALEIKLDLGDQAIVMLTTLVASVGAGGIPSGSFVTMPLIFAAVKLPIDKLPLLLTIDWFLDRCRTVSNVLGDMTVALLLELTHGGPEPGPADPLAANGEAGAAGPLADPAP